MSKPCFEVRHATNADAAAIQELIFPIMKQFGLGPDPAGADRDLVKIEEGYFAIGGWLEIVSLAGKPVGTVGMLPVGDGVIELRKMYLRHDVRGTGLGKALLARSIERARAAGFRQIVLETATVLEAAIGLYQRFGFARDNDAYPGCGKRACDQVWRLTLDDYRLPQTTMAVLQDTNAGTTK